MKKTQNTFVFITLLAVTFTSQSVWPFVGGRTLSTAISGGLGAAFGAGAGLVLGGAMGSFLAYAAKRQAKMAESFLEYFDKDEISFRDGAVVFSSDNELSDFDQRRLIAFATRHKITSENIREKTLELKNKAQNLLKIIAVSALTGAGAVALTGGAAGAAYGYATA